MSATIRRLVDPDGRDRYGPYLTWLSGGALALNLLLVLGLLGVLAANGLDYFWQKDLILLTLDDGRQLLGEIYQHDTNPTDGTRRLQLKVGNRDMTGVDFVWIDEASIAEQAHPEAAIALERREWGNFYGFMVELRVGDRIVARGADEVWQAFPPLHRQKHALLAQIEDLESHEIGDINYEIERLRLRRRKLDITKMPEAARQRRQSEIDRLIAPQQAHYEQLAERLFDLRREWQTGTLVMQTADGTRKEMPVGGVVRALRPNSMGIPGKLLLYSSRLWQFVADDPRESNTEGGIFPAIFGTVMMVFLMTLVVTPLGVLAAVYLREYAKQGLLVQSVRIAVNNLTSVPSIVFGIFGLGFFVYLVGGTIDRLFFPAALPTPTYGTGGILWAALTLALLTVPVVIVATEEGLASVPRVVREGSLALGATKFETTWKVVVPAAAPGILTGMILAMARAAGEVAPLMIVGMVKLAPALPVDHHFPFVHLERKFMHLGFHIYDVGFQSPNVDAVKPLVFATALLLILVVLAMNLVAIVIRNHLRNKYRVPAF
ncbi:MAG: phosphate ABC transporter permease PstA [Acidobacteriota bacterium]